VREAASGRIRCPAMSAQPRAPCGASFWLVSLPAPADANESGRFHWVGSAGRHEKADTGGHDQSARASRHGVGSAFRHVLAPGNCLNVHSTSEREIDSTAELTCVGPSHTVFEPGSAPYVLAAARYRDARLVGPRRNPFALPESTQAGSAVGRDIPQRTMDHSCITCIGQRTVH
jgi:hypothetical protein